MTSLIRHLVAAHIRPGQRKSGLGQVVVTVAMGQPAAAIGAEAAALAGVGLDLMQGECTLAGILVEENPRGAEHRLAAVITNRRSIAGGFSSVKGGLNEIAVAVGHDEIVRVESSDGMLSTKLRVLSTSGSWDLSPVFGHCKELAGFFGALQQVPAGQRGEPVYPALQPSAPSADDPTGAIAASGSLWWHDAFTHAALCEVARRTAAAELAPAAGMDLAARLVLNHRARCSGPAAYGRAFATSLSAAELHHLVSTSFGVPLRHDSSTPGVHVLDVAIAQNGGLHPGLAALGVAAYLGLGVGFSPGRMIAAELMKKQPLTHLRWTFGDMPGGCWFEIQSNAGRLDAHEGRVAHALHRAIIDHAARRLEEALGGPDGRGLTS